MLKTLQTTLQQAREAYRVQEYHLPIYHALAMMLEERFYGAGE